MGARESRLKSLMPLAIIAVLIGGCGKADNRPTGLRRLAEKRDKLHLGMTVAEVDAVMAGYPRKQYKEVRDRGHMIGEFPRESVLNIAYDEKHGANEGDFCLTAYFDKDGKLIATEIQEYIT